MRSFSKIKPSWNDEITLSLIDIGKSCLCRGEFLASQICLLTPFAKIKFSRKFQNLQYLFFCIKHIYSCLCFFRCVIEQGYNLSFSYNLVTNRYVAMATGVGNKLLLLQNLLDEINRCKVLGQQSPVEASKNYPMHGELTCHTPQ